MNQLDNCKKLLHNILYNKNLQNIFLFLISFCILIVCIDLFFGFYKQAFIPNEYGQYNFIARSIHFLSVSVRFILGVFVFLMIFSYIFGSQLGSIFSRLLKNPMAIIGFVILFMLILLATYADFIASYDYVVIKQDLSNAFAKPKFMYLGTDEFGRDIFSRIVHGIRISLIIGFLSVFLSILIGGFLGAVAGYFGGRLDNILMRIMDIFLAIPSILLSIAIVSALGSSMINLVLALSISTVPVYARIVRASVLSIRGQEFVEAAHAIGANDIYIIWYHILPNVISPIIVQGTLGIANAILSIAGLSFIGLGIQPPAPEWGSMLASGRGFIRKAAWVTTFPGVAIMVTILSLNLLGDGLRDALDPRLK